MQVPDSPFCIKGDCSDPEKTTTKKKVAEVFRFLRAGHSSSTASERGEWKGNAAVQKLTLSVGASFHCLQILHTFKNSKACFSINLNWAVRQHLFMVNNMNTFLSSFCLCRAKTICQNQTNWQTLLIRKLFSTKGIFSVTKESLHCVDAVCLCSSCLRPTHFLCHVTAQWVHSLPHPPPQHQSISDHKCWTCLIFTIFKLAWPQSHCYLMRRAKNDCAFN